jgi:hypothetical protein
MWFAYAESWAQGGRTRKALFRDSHHRTNDRIARLCIQEKGEIIMKMLLAGVALAIGVAFASQGLALPYCTWQHSHYVCADYDQ